MENSSLEVLAWKGKKGWKPLRPLSPSTMSQTSWTRLLWDLRMLPYLRQQLHCAISSDRPDLQCSAKEVSRGMAHPTATDSKRVDRPERYLIRSPRAAFRFPFHKSPHDIRVTGDIDLTGCIKTPKSSQGGLVMHSSHCIKSWSSTQSIFCI